MQIIETDTGRALEHDGQQAPLPTLPVGATVHAYTTPDGLWVGVQERGRPRPVYPGVGGKRIGSIELEADPGAVDDIHKAALVSELEALRKDAESDGVTVNGIRYAGNPGNRAALLEVLQFARESGVTTLTAWKDSDGQFHLNHPLSDVEQALLSIANRRSALIALEGQYAAQVVDGTLTSVDALSWTV